MTTIDHQDTTDTCMAIVKGCYKPEDMTMLADRLDRDTLHGIKTWIRSLGSESKPLVLLKIVTMIEMVARGRGNDPEFIKRRIVAECRKYVEHAKMVEEFDKENGERSYIKAWGKLLDRELRKLEGFGKDKR